MDNTQIELKCGLKATVDADNYEWLNQWTWEADQVGNNPYAVRFVKLPDGEQDVIYMHEEVMSRKIVDEHRGVLGKDFVSRFFVPAKERDLMSEEEWDTYENEQIDKLEQK